MQEKSRILVFTTAFRPMIGGSEIALEQIIRRLPGIFFDIVTPKYSRHVKALESGPNFNVYRIGPEGVFGKIIFPVSGFFKAVKLIRRHRYNFTHAYQASYGGGAAWLLKFFYPRLPFMLTMQEGKRLDAQPLILNWLRGLIIKRADQVTVISNYLKKYVLSVNPKARITVIPNGVDLQKFKIKNEKLKINETVIITISRLVEKNGIRDLIDAFFILNSKFEIRNSKLLIIGEGPLKESLKFKVKSLKLENKVEFLGAISNEELPKYLEQADVFVRPSLSEGLGTAFLEAMAAGLSVVGTPVGGINDFLTNGETGIFCRVGDPEDLADKIRIILSDDKLRNKLIQNGRKLVEEKYTWDKIAKEFRKQYSNIAT